MYHCRSPPAPSVVWWSLSPAVGVLPCGSLTSVKPPETRSHVAWRRRVNRPMSWGVVGPITANQSVVNIHSCLYINIPLYGIYIYIFLYIWIYPIAIVYWLCIAYLMTNKHATRYRQANANSGDRSDEVWPLRMSIVSWSTHRWAVPHHFVTSLFSPLNLSWFDDPIMVINFHNH